jgi:hypothetical protein
MNNDNIRNNMYFIVMANIKDPKPILFCCKRISGSHPFVLNDINTMLIDDNILSEYYEGGYIWLYFVSELDDSATNEEIGSKIAEWNFYRHFNFKKPDTFLPYIKMERNNKDVMFY